MTTFHLRIEPGHYVPREGETIHMQGLAGIYLVKIEHILTREVHPDDGAILMKVQGTKQVVQEAGA
jgi:hypothetical protein